MIHRHLKKLLIEWKIYKEWTPPKVLYYATGGTSLDIVREDGLTTFTLKHNGKVITKAEKFLKKWYLLGRWKEYMQQCISDVEHILDLHQQWWQSIKPNLLYNTFAQVYITSDEVLQDKFDAYMKQNFPEINNDTDSWVLLRFFGVYLLLDQYRAEYGLYDASSKLWSLTSEYKTCQDKVWLDGLWYNGVDKIDAHKSHNYMIMESVKEFQDKAEIYDYYTQSFDARFDWLLQDLEIDTILVVPNNVTRQISFNEYIQTQLKKRYPQLKFISTDTNTFVGRKPQKKVKGICNRIENAEKLFEIDVLSVQKSSKNILLIDDVFGSGATINTVTKKLKTILPDCICHWFALLGSYRKGFDVVSGI